MYKHGLKVTAEPAQGPRNAICDPFFVIFSHFKQIRAKECDRLMDIKMIGVSHEQTL